jgi:hypothetical protein
MALYICKDKDFADDMVQDMYVYFSDKEGEFNDGYVYFALKDIFLMQVSKKYVKNRLEFVELDDNYNFEFDIYDFDKDYQKQKKIDRINQVFESCDQIEKIIIGNSIQSGLRKFSRESGISTATVQKYRQQFKDKVWQKK